MTVGIFYLFISFNIKSELSFFVTQEGLQEFGFLLRGNKKSLVREQLLIALF